MKRGFRDRVARTRVTLWTLIVPPTLWAAHFLLSYLWAAVLCAKTGSFARYPAAFVIGTVVALVLIVASGWVAWLQANSPGDPPPHDEGTDSDRLRFLAVATLMLAALSFVGVIFTALPVVFIGNCR